MLKKRQPYVTWRGWCVGAAILLCLVALGTLTPSYEECQTKLEQQPISQYSGQVPDWVFLLSHSAVCEGVVIDENEGILTVVSTLIIALFTYTLWRSTTELADFAEQQAADMKDSVRIAGEAAKAATTSTEAAKLHNIVALRAYIAFTQFLWEPVLDGDQLIGAKIGMEWKNTGPTHAKNVELATQIGWVVSRSGADVPDAMIDRHLRFIPLSDRPRLSIIHPEMLVEKFSTYVITREELVRMFNKTARLFIRGCVTYNDVMPATEQRHTSVCCEVILKRDDPKAPLSIKEMPFRFPTHWKHNSAN